MLTLCWFYCIPFAKFLYFATAPLLLMIAMFVLKRGIRRARLDLRQTAFFMMFAAAVKFFLFDIRMLEEQILCDVKGHGLGCSAAGFRMLEFAGLFAMVGVSVLLFHFYRVFSVHRKPEEITVQDVHLRFWVNVTFFSVLMMVFWQLAPWIGALLGWKASIFFMSVAWQPFAVGNLILLTTCFWKAESCAMGYRLSRRGNQRRIRGTWTPKDLLWTTTFLYLLTLALSYVAHDVM